MRKKLKIAIVFKPYWQIKVPNLGGMSNFVYFLSKGLAERGHQVTVFCSKNSELQKGVRTVKEKNSEDDLNIYHAHDRFYKEIEKKAGSLREAVNMSFGELSKRFDYKIENYLQAFSKAYTGKYDVIHVVTHDTLALYPALFSPVPTVVSFHGHYGMLGPDFLRWLKYLKNEKPKMNCKFVSVSKFIKREYDKYVDSSLIYNSIDIAPYKLELKKKDYVALLVARIEYNKGVDIAIKFSQTYKIPLVIAGNINDPYFYKHFVKKNIDNKLIKYIGAVNEKQKSKFLREAKCMIMPSRYKEAFGRVVIESLASGTPVISFNNGALKELVVNGKTGFIVKEGSLKEIKRAYDRIEEIDKKYCRKFVEKNFIIDRMLKEYEEIYQKSKE